MRKTSSSRSIGVCTWQHTTIDATSLGVGKSCGKVLENFRELVLDGKSVSGMKTVKTSPKGIKNEIL